MIRCKMYVSEKQDRAYAAYGGGPGVRQQESVVKLSAATDDGNKEWSKYTPSGQIELHITNPVAFEAFKLGQFYLVDFVEAPADEASEQK